MGGVAFLPPAALAAGEVVGGAMECTVSADGERQVVRVVVEDLDGTVHLEEA
jgi:hypothetical protein